MKAKSAVRSDLDAEHDFEYEGEQYNYFQYTLGQQVEFCNDNDGHWFKGTLVRIDDEDSGLPWGVTSEPMDDPDEDDIDAAEYNWKPPNWVRPSEYVINEEEDTPVAVSW